MKSTSDPAVAAVGGVSLLTPAAKLGLYDVVEYQAPKGSAVAKIPLIVVVTAALPRAIDVAVTPPNVRAAAVSTLGVIVLVLRYSV